MQLSENPHQDTGLPAPRLHRPVFTVKLFVLSLPLSLVLVLGILFLVKARGYWGPRSFAIQEAKPVATELVINAKTLSGTPYDYLGGRFCNLGASLGSIVCADVPLIAYGKSKYSLETAMKADILLHPENYHLDASNSPSSEFFFRRARNIYDYFKSKQAMREASLQPSLGDLAFYTHKEDAYVCHVAMVSAVTASGYRIIEADPSIIFTAEVDSRDPPSKGLELVGFGHLQ